MSYTHVGAGRVTFACSGTIALTNTLTITGDVTIDGSGQDVTFSGNNAVRVLSVGLGGTLNLNQLTIANGRADFGGGMHSRGTLTVSNSIFKDNDADLYCGGIYIDGGQMTVKNSTFSDNHSAHGGGGMFSLNGTMDVSNSVFSGNSTADLGGVFGGGIFANGGTLTVSDSTFFGNGSPSLGSSSIYKESGTALQKNTIVVKGGGGRSCAGVIVDGGGNLSYPDDSCHGITADPALGPLQDNGGPTFTMEPDLASPAINGGNDITCQSDPVSSHDQRGVMRPVGPHCDIGAVEANYLPFRKWFALVEVR